MRFSLTVWRCLMFAVAANITTKIMQW